MLVFMLHWDVGGRDPPRSNLLLWPFRFLGRKLGLCCSSSEKYDYDCQGKEFIGISYHWFKKFYVSGIGFRLWAVKNFNNKK
jgi:hypothetical protein